MNNTNILTIQLHDSPEDPSTCAMSSADWQHIRENSYSTLAELKKIKLTVFKEKLNLYNEKCRIKDDVILTLRTCLETYKNTNLNNNDVITFLKSKLCERRQNSIAIQKSFKKQLTELENSNRDKSEKIVKQDELITDKDNYILKLEQQLKKTADQLQEKTQLSFDYQQRIVALEANIEQKDLQLADRKVTIQEKEDQISVLKNEVATTRDKLNATQELLRSWKTQNFIQAFNSKDAHRAKLETELRNSTERIKKQNDRLLQYSIKELQASLSEEESSTELKVLTLPRIGSLKVLAQNCISGPGWIVIHRRMDDSVNFNQGWFSFVDGFGDMDGDFWMGLDNVHAMTKRQTHELYVHLVFPNNETRFAHYDNFAISGKNDDYKLKSLGNYFGNAGDGLRPHEHCIFKTVRYNSKNAVQYNRWWHHEYPSCNLNGVFNHKSEFGVWWCRQKDTFVFVESVQMLIRPKLI
ncbi:fibroleukin-like [Drosophila sulfurigaster albostrigata]|uniref:fibroleukin-like n=1 Tax=Drosophila sulfurigaster albostrigata TaxID=89887 RepID=UPI002D21E421|nr:fibroleukin-like [Drosophila sulfurigaster albostrigata]